MSEVLVELSGLKVLSTQVKITVHGICLTETTGVQQSFMEG